MKNKRANVLFNAALLTAALALSVLAIIAGPYFQGGYRIELGGYSPVRFKAPKDTVNEFATERLKREAAENVGVIYRRDREITQAVLDKLDFALEAIREERISRNPLDTPYQDDRQEAADIRNLAELGISLSGEQASYLVFCASNNFSDFCSAVRYVAEYALEKGVREDELEKVKLSVKDEVASYVEDSAERMIASVIISALLEPNYFPDEDATAAARALASDAVMPVIISGGQKIVDEGEKITEEIYHVLESLGYTNKNLAENIFSVAGVAGICLIAFASVVMYAHYFCRSIIYLRRNALMLFTFFCLTIISAWALKAVPYQFVPILLFAMLISILLDARLAIIASFASTIICSFVLRADTEFVLYFMLTGLFSALFAKYTTERSKMFSVGLVISAASGLSAIAVGLIFSGASLDYQQLTSAAVYAVLNGVLVVTLCVGSLPLWEAVFGVVTPIKLLDLANPSNKLLRRLALEAPGTYHHSLIVSNLAETAAYDIGANSLLAKVGGYYHDVGKLKFPGYFSENIVGDNPHDSITPYDSVAVITEHVSYGLELAKEYKLPQNIVSFVDEHHGATLIKYFYYKALKLYPEGEVNESDFRYAFHIPASKETAILMLADTAEAAVRSMIPAGKPMSEIDAFVRELIKDKLDDGQLVKSNLTLTEIDDITKAFMKVFRGMYHERIPYPKAARTRA